MFPASWLDLLLRLEPAVFLFGAAGDIAYHVLPHGVTHQLHPSVGAHASRARLATLAGLLSVSAGLIGKGVGLVDTR